MILGLLLFPAPRWQKPLGGDTECPLCHQTTLLKTTPELGDYEWKNMGTGSPVQVPCHRACPFRVTWKPASQAVKRSCFYCSSDFPTLGQLHTFTWSCLLLTRGFPWNKVPEVALNDFKDFYSNKTHHYLKSYEPGARLWLTVFSGREYESETTGGDQVVGVIVINTLRVHLQTFPFHLYTRKGQNTYSNMCSRRRIALLLPEPQ